MDEGADIKIIKSYKDLKFCGEGQFISINGRKEVIIDPFSSKLREAAFPNAEVYTLSLEGDYLVYNLYNGERSSDFENLEPFRKACCRRESGDYLEILLLENAFEKGLIKPNG